jgi:hypothetical protein
MHFMLPQWITKVKATDMQKASISNISTIHENGSGCISCIVNIHDNCLLAGKLVQKLLH